MIARISLWSLSDTDATVGELREERLPRSPGAVYEAWFSDEATKRWGAFAIFPDADAAAEPPPDRLRELIAKAPDVVELFDLAAS